MKAKRIISVFTILSLILTCFIVPSFADFSATQNEADFSYTGYTQVYTVPKTGEYFIEVHAGSGGNRINSASHSNYGGKGGAVRARVTLQAGQVLYFNVGGEGQDWNYVLGAGGDRAIFGGGGAGYYLNHNLTNTGPGGGSGGGSTDVRIGSNNLSSRIIVAGGGGGASFNANGNAGGGAGSGDNGTLHYGSNGPSPGGGGGGGYYGGSCGCNGSKSANGGSNYFDETYGQLLFNKSGFNLGAGSAHIEYIGNYSLTVKLNDGKIDGYSNDLTYQKSGSSAGASSYTFYPTGYTQTFTAPDDGTYKLTVLGAAGSGVGFGYGGKSEGFIDLKKGTTLYVNVGGRTGNLYAGWNGAGSSLESHGYGGGGATDISLYGTSGTTNWNTREHLYSRIIVAGGGGGTDDVGGGSPNDGLGGAGGGTTGGTGAGASGPGGSQTSGYAFGYGGSGWTHDAGGAGGGWYGGHSGGGNVNGGGSGGSGYIYSASTAYYYPSGCLLNSSYYVSGGKMYTGANGGAGQAIIKKADIVILPTPTKEGYNFTGWSVVSGSGHIEDGNIFYYADGETVVQANWQKIIGYSNLTINPNEGYYNDTQEVTKISKYKNTTIAISTPKRNGYVFTGWQFVGSGSFDGTNYTFGQETEATLTATWREAESTLTVDPNTGTYKGSEECVVYKNRKFGEVQEIEDPSKVGYQFQYWKETLSSDGFLDDKGFHFVTTDAYLKAIWEPNTYDVVYVNYDGKGNNYVQHCTYDEEYNYLKNPDEIDDLVFVGWFNKENPQNLADGVISGGTKFKNLTIIHQDTLYVYGKWHKTEITDEDKNPQVIETTQIQITGDNIYKNPHADKSYFVKSNVDFNLSFNGHINGEINTNFLPIYVNKDTFDIGPGQTFSISDKTQNIGKLSVNPENEGNILKCINTDMERKVFARLNQNDNLLSLTQTFNATGDNEKIEVIPHAQSSIVRTKDGSEYTTIFKTSQKSDKLHNINLISDGKEPTIINQESLNEDLVFMTTKQDINIDFVDYIRNVDPANPQYGSGIDTNKVKVIITQEQTDNGGAPFIQEFSASTVSNMVKIETGEYTGSIKIKIDPTAADALAGFIDIDIEIPDNVGNVATKHIRLLVMHLDASLSNADTLSSRPGSNVFAAGEQGKIDIETNGFVDQVEIVFPQELEDLANTTKVTTGSYDKDTQTSNISIDTGRILSETYPRNELGQVTTVLPNFQTKLWGTINKGGMQYNSTNSSFENCYLQHFFYTPLYSPDGKYTVYVTAYKTDINGDGRIYEITKELTIYIGIDPANTHIDDITTEFSDKIKDN